mmetsp:Transcript_7808/g.21738  ORF Transcript_7808/g.21738 Transcript_7808/m.21738 type:complete len:143 (+) Transcript_7808:1265-1693(+)
MDRDDAEEEDDDTDDVDSSSLLSGVSRLGLVGPLDTAACARTPISTSWISFNRVGLSDDIHASLIPPPLLSLTPSLLPAHCDWSGLDMLRVGSSHLLRLGLILSNACVVLNYQLYRYRPANCSIRASTSTTEYYVVDTFIYM